MHPGRNAVFLRVPVSTTHPNGVVPCAVTSATAARLVCEAGAHCAADASASDPGATKCRHLPTPAAEVFVSACPALLRTDLGDWTPSDTDFGRLR